MRLRRSTPDGPGLARTRRGKGFSYCDAQGSPVDDATQSRIRSLIIPPAWRSVWICPYPNGHIQAVGIDAAGRQRYIYHPQWRIARDEEKYDRVLRLGSLMPGFRRAIDKDLRARGARRERAEAAALRLLDRGVFRVGNEEYVEENGFYGVATLLREHVQFSKETIAFDFPAKSGIRRTLVITDAPLVRALRSPQKNVDQSGRLLVYSEGDSLEPITAEDINARFKSLVGERYSVKDLRTWNATVLAAVAFVDQDIPRSERKRAQAVSAVMNGLSTALGNTPIMARKSYVDPRVVEAYEAGVTISRAVGRAEKLTDPAQSHTVIEKAVIRMIKAVPR